VQKLIIVGQVLEENRGDSGDVVFEHGREIVRGEIVKQLDHQVELSEPLGQVLFV
jgi:hypothetical protein